MHAEAPKKEKSLTLAIEEEIDKVFKKVVSDVVEVTKEKEETKKEECNNVEINKQGDMTVYDSSDEQQEENEKFRDEAMKEETGEEKADEEEEEEYVEEGEYFSVSSKELELTEGSSKTDVDVTPEVTPKKVKGPAKVNTPYSTKNISKKTTPFKTPTKPKPP